MDDLVKIGYTMKAHGLKGDIKVNVEEKYEDDFEEAKVLFIASKGSTVPYFVEQIRFGNQTLLKLEDINRPEDTLSISSKEIFMKASDIQYAVDDEESPNVKYLAYTIYDGDLEIGVVEEIIDAPQQILAIITYKTKEVFIPLNDIFIVKIDDAKKEIYMSLPEGILDL
jgi:16S rRNA processing protein RimM